MEGGEGILDAIYEDETLDYDEGDVEMADADESPVADAGKTPVADAGDDGGGGTASKVRPGKKKKKRRSGKNKKRLDRPPTKIADVNRFVLDTCRRLKEKKSYLVWNAIGCLGVSAVSDLVREVEAIQKCGGQMIADGSRFRSGGGILWNILKSREPKAYKEIMAKGRELEKQFRQTKVRPQMSKNEDTSSQGSALVEEELEALGEKDALDDPEKLVDVEEADPSDDKTKRKPVTERIRVPVAYDDLFEEGEINEGEPQN